MNPHRISSPKWSLNTSLYYISVSYDLNSVYLFTCEVASPAVVPFVVFFLSFYLDYYLNYLISDLVKICFSCFY